MTDPTSGSQRPDVISSATTPPSMGPSDKKKDAEDSGWGTFIIVGIVVMGLWSASGKDKKPVHHAPGSSSGGFTSSVRSVAEEEKYQEQLNDYRKDVADVKFTTTGEQMRKEDKP